MSDIKAGDVVVLKSGSDKMTVGQIFKPNNLTMAAVVWQDQKGEHKTANYAVEALEKP
jgi:uncharacterized protein YodC (DUF2158 family)